MANPGSDLARTASIGGTPVVNRRGGEKGVR